MAAENFKVKRGLEVGTGTTITSGGVDITGIITAVQFKGDGSGLTGVVGSGSGVIIKDEGSTVGTAGTINFVGSGIAAAISEGTATVTLGVSTANVVTDSLVSAAATVNGETILNGNVSFYGANYGAIWRKNNSRFQLNDNAELTFGTSNDTTIKHDNSNLLISNTTGIASVTGSVSVGGISTLGFGSSGQVTIQHQGSTKLQTQTWGIDVSGVIQGETAIQCHTNATGALAKTTHGLIHGASKQAIFQFNSVDDKIYLINNTSDKEFALLANDSGDVGWKVIPDGDVELYHDNTKRLATNGIGATVFGQLDTTDLNVTGITTSIGKFHIRPSGGALSPKISYNDSIADAMIWADGVQARFGTSSDLKIYHDNESIIHHTGTGVFKIQGNGGNNTFLRAKEAQNSVTLVPDGEVILHHNGGERFETTGVGVTIFGTTQTQQLNVSGISTFSDSVRIGDNASYTANVNGDNLVVGSTSGNHGITIVSGNTGQLSGGLFFGDSGSAIAGGIRYFHLTNYMQFRIAGGERLRITGGGHVGIGTEDPLDAVTSDNTKKLSVGIVSAYQFYGDGSNITGVTASGTGVIVKHDGSTVGTASTINFSTNLDVSPIHTGIVTVTASGGGGGGITINNNGTSKVITGSGTTDTLNANVNLTFDGTTLDVKSGTGVVNTGSVVVGSGVTIDSTGIKATGLGITAYNLIANHRLTVGSGIYGTAKILLSGGDGGDTDYYSGGNSYSEHIFRLLQSGSSITRFRINRYGVDVLGIATATSFSGSGIGLTSLDAGNLGIGTIPNGRFPATLPAVSGANLTSLTAGNISGTLATSQIADEAITFAKMQHVGTGVLIGRNDSGSGDIETLTAAEVRTLINVEDGATAGGGTTINNNADNRVITGSNSANTLEAESSLTFDGTTLTATSFSGGGNNIVTARWTLGANGSSHYTFTGPGGLSNTDDPKIYLARGQTYEFVNNSGGSHPFQIQQSNGSAYSTGVTNNGASSGTIKFEVPFSAPNTLQYKCTSHGSMGNTIIVYPDLSP